ncbi:MAG: aminomethyl-transferring glycine dehydrogenase subunit GcvPB, partial [Deltaproteobacteria bacterium]|nr:aminomethyl-transferring glycine dehydrogenase subunit GcvPB [Deltaproteobacteria bacterium]
MDLIFEKSRSGRRASRIPESDVPELPVEKVIDKHLLRDDVDLPELSELDIVRHYTELSRRNFGVDAGFYPLGSCTMKYNPKINEDAARLPGLSALHPYAPAEFCQGNLSLMYELQRMLSEIFGMAAFTLQPSAGAHGELTGVMMIKKHFDTK